MRHPHPNACLVAGSTLIFALGIGGCGSQQPGSVDAPRVNSPPPIEGRVVAPIEGVPPQRFCPMSAFVRHVEIRGGVALVEAGDVLCGVDPQTLKGLWRTRLCSRGLYLDDQQPRYTMLSTNVLVWRAGKTRGNKTELSLESLDIRSGRVRWRYDVGSLTSIPRCLIAGDALVLSEACGEQLSGKQQLACLDLATGKRRWYRPDETPLAVSSASDTHLKLGFGPERSVCSAATGAPAAWDELTEAERTALQQDSYFCGKVQCVVTELWSGRDERVVHINAREWGSCGLYFGRDVIVRIRRGQVIDPDNPVDAIWCYRPPGHENAAHVVGSVSYGDRLVVLMNRIPRDNTSETYKRVICVGQPDGQSRWRLACDRITTLGVLLGKTMLFGTERAIHGVDVESGTVLWTHDTQGSTRHRPVIVGSAAVFGDDNGLIALDAAGEVVWQRPLEGGLRAAPMKIKEWLLVPSAGLSLLDGAGGKPVQPTREVAASAIGNAPPVTDGQTIYVLTRSGRIHAVDRKTLAPRWRVHILPTSCRQFRDNGCLACDGETVCAASGQQLVAVGKDNGELLWRRDFDSFVVGLACSEGRAFVLADKVYALDLASGAPAWEFKPKHYLSRYGWYLGDMSPLLHDGQIYFTDWVRLYCLRAETGKEVWTTPVAEDQDDRVFGMPRQSGRRLLYTSQDHGLYTIDLASGTRERLLDHAPALGGHEAYGIVSGELYCPTTYLEIVRVLAAKDGAELAAIQLDDRAISPLAPIGDAFVLGGQHSLIVISSRRRAVDRTIATGFPAPYLLPTGDTILVVDHGLKEYE